MTTQLGPGPQPPAGWYPSPGLPGQPETAGHILRWWTGTAWGHDVARLDTQPDPPPTWRRHQIGEEPTEPLALPATIAPREDEVD